MLSELVKRVRLFIMRADECGICGAASGHFPSCPFYP